MMTASRRVVRIATLLFLGLALLGLNAWAEDPCCSSRAVDVRGPGAEAQAPVGGTPLPMAPAGTAYLAANWNDSAVHFLDSGMNDLGSFGTCSNPNGLAADGTHIYVGSFQLPGVYVYDWNGVLQHQWSSPYCQYLQGLEYVDGTLAVESDTLINFLDPATGAFIRSIPSQGSTVEGLAYDGTYLWQLADDLIATDPATGAFVRSVPNAALGCSYGGTGLTTGGPGELILGCAGGQWYKVSSADGSVIASGNNGLAMFGLASSPDAASPPGLAVTPVSVCAGTTVVPLSITPTLTVTDGSEVLGNLLISGVPTGATLSAGTDQGSGTWLLTPSQLAGLSITLPVGTTSFTLTVKASEAKNTVLLPEADSFVDSSNPTGNYGASGQLQVLTYGLTWDSYLRYNLAALPQGADITAAMFTIIFFNGYAYGGDGNHYLFFVPDDTWAEMGITWNNRPAYTTNLGYWWPWNDWTPRYWLVGVDVTSMVKTELAGDQKVSFCIHNGGSYSGYYYSRETGATNSPKLTVTHSPAYTTKPLPVTLVSVALSPATLSGGVVGAPYSQTLTASAGVPPYTWSITGSTIPGVNLTPSASPSLTATLAGTPSSAGTYTFTVTVTDSNGCQGSQAYAAVVCPAITISPAAVPPPIYGKKYCQQLTASPCEGSCTYTLQSGSLPAGLTMDTTGYISGIPMVHGGTYTFTVRATTMGGCYGERTYTTGVYDVMFADDNKRSLFFVDPASGVYRWDILKGAGKAGSPYTGVLKVLNSGTLFVTNPGDPNSIYFVYDVYYHKANGYFYRGAIYSPLVDQNTLNDTPTCP